MPPLHSLKVLFLAAEADPFIKAGGLGDVAGSLPAALRSLEIHPSQNYGSEESPIDIRLAIPAHHSINLSSYSTQTVATFSIPHQDGPLQAVVYQTEVQGLPVYLIGGGPFEHALPIYTNDNAQDGLRYTFFSLAALKLARMLGWRPDILHANDWHTAPAVYSLSLRRPSDPFFHHTHSLITIHNLPYLGLGAGPGLQSFGLPPATGSALPDWAQAAPLPLGLLTADRIVAVSPTYAEEIMTPGFGSGLADFLTSRSDTVSGILNGIDVARWDPHTDTALLMNYGRDELVKRNEDRATLRTELGFDPDFKTPILAIVSRLDPQKGIDLALDSLRYLAHEPGQPAWQAVILGTGQAALETAARQLEADFPERVRAMIRFDVALSRRVYAGADLLLIPSRYEPCGLTQMIAMRYGCVPLARATGGLQDTIVDEDQSRTATGFLFQQASVDDLTEALIRALAIYPNNQRWQTLQRNGMGKDFSWTQSAREYLGVYEELVERL